MKRTYIQPTTETIEIGYAQPLMTVSGGNVFDDPANPELPTLAPGMEIPGLENIPGGGF